MKKATRLRLINNSDLMSERAWAVSFGIDPSSELMNSEYRHMIRYVDMGVQSNQPVNVGNLTNALQKNFGKDDKTWRKKIKRAEDAGFFFRGQNPEDKRSEVFFTTEKTDAALQMFADFQISILHELIKQTTDQTGSLLPGKPLQEDIRFDILEILGIEEDDQ